MTDKKCPNCGLWNTGSALLCDCGYNFEKGSMDKYDDKQQILNKGKTRGLNIAFYLASFVWGGVGYVCIFLAIAAIAFHDFPIKNKFLDNILFYSIISFPIVSIGSSIAIQVLKNEYPKIAFGVSLLPIFPLILIFAINTWASK